MMSRSSLVLGFVISLALHGLLLIGPLKTKAKIQEPHENPAAKVLVRPAAEVVDEAEAAVVETKSASDDQQADPIKDTQPPSDQVMEQAVLAHEEAQLDYPDLAPSKEEPPPSSLPLETVVTPAQVDESRSVLHERAPQLRSDSTEGDDAPIPIRILWESPEQLRVMAKPLGIRILAVDHSGVVLGEIPTDSSSIRLDQYRPSGSYSNRVREIRDRNYFGEIPDRDVRERIRAYWLLLPVELDEKLSSIAESRLRQDRLERNRVRHIRGRFVWQGDSVPEFLIDQVLHR